MSSAQPDPQTPAVPRTQADPRNDETGSAPVSTDRPVVNGADVSAQQLRDDIDRERNPDQVRVEELRADVAETAEELAARFDVPARLQVGKQRAVASLRAAGDRARANPAALAGAAALVLLVVFLRRRRANS